MGGLRHARLERLVFNFRVRRRVWALGDLGNVNDPATCLSVVDG